MVARHHPSRQENGRDQGIRAAATEYPTNWLCHDISDDFWSASDSPQIIMTSVLILSVSVFSRSAPQTGANRTVSSLPYLPVHNGLWIYRTRFYVCPGQRVVTQKLGAIWTCARARKRPSPALLPSRRARTAQVGTLPHGADHTHVIACPYAPRSVTTVRPSTTIEHAAGAAS